MKPQDPKHPSRPEFEQTKHGKSHGNEVNKPMQKPGQGQEKQNQNTSWKQTDKTGKKT